MRINVHAGHNPAGMTACGAIGLINESTENRKVKNEVIRLLKMRNDTVYDCTVDNGTHYLVVTQYHCFLLSPTADLLWYVSVQNLNIEVDEEEMRLLGGGESKLVLFADKDICSRVYGILINMSNWTNKEIVQCSKDFVKFVDSRSRRSFWRRERR